MKKQEHVLVHLKVSLKSLKHNLEKNVPFELEQWPLQTFISTAIICFVASSLMHLLWVRSLHTCNLTHNIDLTGISLLIFGSAFGFLYYVFKCDRTWLYVYTGILASAMLGIVITINCKLFHGEKYQNLKVILFVIQASVGLIAVGHWRFMMYACIKQGKTLKKSCLFGTTREDF